MPNQFVDEPAFGRVNTAEVYGGRRRIQAGVRFLFLRTAVAQMRRQTLGRFCMAMNVSLSLK